jgi:hypothetical protein
MNKEHPAVGVAAWIALAAIVLIVAQCVCNGCAI